MARQTLRAVSLGEEFGFDLIWPAYEAFCFISGRESGPVSSEQGGTVVNYPSRGARPFKGLLLKKALE